MKLFIHIPKTGGMSIRHGFQEKIVATKNPDMFCNKEYVKGLENRMNKDGEHTGYAHARWRDVRADLQKLKAFAVVRNPWDRVASRYYFALQAVRLNQTYGKNYRNIKTFDDFLAERNKFGGREFYWHRAIRGWYQQRDYVVDLNGILRCDVLRTEYLDNDVELYLGQKPPRRRNVTTGRVPYKELYDKRTIQIVADWYEEDIDFFGFDFDNAATKNIWGGLKKR